MQKLRCKVFSNYFHMTSGHVTKKDFSNKDTHNLRFISCQNENITLIIYFYYYLVYVSERRINLISKRFWREKLLNIFVELEV